MLLYNILNYELVNENTQPFKYGLEQGFSTQEVVLVLGFGNTGLEYS
jgi:hypothetical protein